MCLGGGWGWRLVLPALLTRVDLGVLLVELPFPPLGVGSLVVFV